MDGFALDRFVTAQDGPSWHRDGHTQYARALDEVRAGEKQCHWMWFVFPQLRCLGSSSTAKRYGLSGAAEARAYLCHPVLGPRLVECMRAAANVPRPRTAVDVFGHTDALKLRSCATLFASVAAEPDEREVFNVVLVRYYQGQADDRTLAELERQSAASATVSALDWAVVADRYDGSFWDVFSPQRAVLQLLAAHEITALLDVGCGTGTLAAAVRAQHASARVAAVDSSDEMLRRARAKDAQLDTRLVDVAHALASEYPRGPFSHVVSCISLMFVPVPGHALARWAELLQPGGHLIVATWGRRQQCTAVETLEKALGRNVHPSNWRLSDLDALAGLVRSCGLFSTVRAERVLVHRADGTRSALLASVALAAGMVGVDVSSEWKQWVADVDDAVLAQWDAMEVNLVVATKPK